MPFAVAVAVAVLVRLIGGERRGPRFVVVSAAISFLVAYAAIEGVPAFPASGAKQKVFYLVLAGSVLGLVLDVRDRNALAERVAILVVPALGLLWMAQRLLSFGFDIDVLLPLLLLWVASIVILWRLSRGATDGLITPGIQILVAGVGLSVVALFGASASLAQLSAGLAAATGGVLL